MKRISIIMIAAALLAGCANAPLDTKEAADLSALPYPASAPLGEDLNIIVTQENGLLGGGTLKVTNITAHPFHDVQLWLNQQYVAKVHEVPAALGGKATTIPLDQFIDKHRRAYPTGKFLKPELAFPVVLAEIFDPASGRRYRLLVQKE